MPSKKKVNKSEDKFLYKWNEAIAEAKAQIATLKKSIRYFEYFRDKGVPFPEPKKKKRLKT